MALYRNPKGGCMKILLPTSLPLEATLPEGAFSVMYDPTEVMDALHSDATGLVVWGNSYENLGSISESLSSLRWVQSLGAGNEVLTKLNLPRDVICTSGVGLHDRPVAEHACALTLYLVRRISEASEAQTRCEWTPSLGGRQPLRPRLGPITTLFRSRIVIWGFGSIGLHLARMLSGFGADVSGIANSAGIRGGYDVAGPEGVDRALREADVLILALPNHASTVHALSKARIKVMRQGAFVVNVGRGSTVDETALIEALEDGRLAGAALDVVSTEPLPSSSELWKAPNLLITPHAAGGRPVGADELIAHNVDAILHGRTMRNVVRWE